MGISSYNTIIILTQGGISVKENLDTMTAEIDLMDSNKLYIVKNGQLIEHELPPYGETVVVTLGGKVDRLETTVKRKV